MAKHVVIAVPAYSWTVQIATMRSIITDLVTLIGRGDRVSMLDESGSTDLPDARAIIVGQFLAGDGTDIVCVDADVCWEAGGLVRLVDAPGDMVAGVYPRRVDPIEFPVQFLPGDLVATDGLLPVEAVPFGFVRLSRAMLERMVAAYPELRGPSSRSPTGMLTALYEPLRLPDGTRVGEDLAFCHRWRALGGAILVDPEIRMGHVGPKLFPGRLGEWLRERMETP